MSKNVFTSVKGLHPRRNSFSAHTYRNDFTSSLGVNIPVYQQHVTAATRVRVSASAIVRLQALIAPIMDNIDFYVHFWKIPYRLLEHDRFTQFFTGEIDAEDYDALFMTPREFAQNLFAVVYADLENVDNAANVCKFIFGDGQIFDFLGYDKGLFPTTIAPVVGEEGVYAWTDGNNYKSFNFRPLIAYYMLHQNWYMNENVPYFSGFADMVENLVKEQSATTLCQILYESYDSFGTTLLPHGWEKDYYTSGLPNVQFGSPVTLPISGSAPVIIPPQTIIQNPVDSPTQLDYIQLGGDAPFVSGNAYIESTGGKAGKLRGSSNVTVNQIISKLEGNTGTGNLVASADLSEATAITINELRFANALQTFKERQMRFGRRRLEFYKGFFDVSPEDLRMQVPKYLGGGRIPINISDIEQTSSTTSTQPLGRLAGKATAVAGGFAGFSTFCSEESIIIGIAFAMPHITYAQSTSRFLFKTNDVYDYFNPSFEHLGEQAIEKIEIYSKAPDNEFAYTPRYNEYRFHSNEVHGAFKNTLSYWTLARIFNNTPALNADFIYMQPGVFNRIFAVDDSQPLMASMLFRQRIVQPVSKYGTPMLLS